MNSNVTSPTSLAIMLPSNSYEILSTSSLWQLVAEVPAACELTIIGTGSSQTTITTDGGGERVFYVGGSGSLVLQNLIVTGGHTVNSYNGGGGGIYLNPGATLTLNMVSVTGNKAGFTGTASAGANGTWNNSGGNGANGNPGYGGGIYMAGGTLNLLSNSSVTGNTVSGQNGGKGGNGGQGSSSSRWNYGEAKYTCDNKSGGKGGNGGNGGNALGAGIFQAGGTINCSNGSVISGNASLPGQGGSFGSGGGGANGGNRCSAGSGSPGKSGANGLPTTSSPGGTNYYYNNGQTVYTAISTASVQSIGGLYQSSGTINQKGIPVNIQANRIPGVIIELHGEDGHLISTATTDQKGQFHFATHYSGIGYVQFVPVPTHELASKGSRLPSGITSSIDSSTLKSDMVQFLDGSALNGNLNIVLMPIDTKIVIRDNNISLNRSDSRDILWKTQVMPKSYRGGFSVSTIDFNNDRTTDYILIPKSGSPTAFFVDGRTGQSTRISGLVSSFLRKGFTVTTANISGDSNLEYILAPSKHYSGRISAIDLKAKKVLWTSKDYVAGGMDISTEGSDPLGKAPTVNIRLTSITNSETYKVINGSTGKLVEARSERKKMPMSKPMMTHSTAISNSSSVSIPRRRLPVMN